MIQQTLTHAAFYKIPHPRLNPPGRTESWVEIEYERTKDEADSIKTEYRQPGSRLDYFWP